MTPERLEELAQMLWANVVGARLVAGGDGNTYTVTTPSIATVRAALTAVYPLIRDEVIEECAEKVTRTSDYISALNIRALKSKDTKL